MVKGCGHTHTHVYVYTYLYTINTRVFIYCVTIADTSGSLELALSFSLSRHGLQLRLSLSVMVMYPRKYNPFPLTPTHTMKLIFYDDYKYIYERLKFSVKVQTIVESNRCSISKLKMFYVISESIKKVLKYILK